MKKNFVFIMTSVFLTALYSNVAFAAKSEVPSVMQPNSIIIYDDEGNPSVVSGGYVESNKFFDENKIPDFNIDDYMRKVPVDATDEEREAIEKENQIIREALEDIKNGKEVIHNEIEIIPGMKVIYDENGNLYDIYYVDDFCPEGYTIHGNAEHMASNMLAQDELADELSAAPSQNALSVQSGGTVSKVDAVPAYMYKDSNYFMLRDIGKIVGYQVDWDRDTEKAILKKDNNAQNLNNLSTVKQSENVNKEKQTIVIDGKEYNGIECLNIDGYNYFKLRDLAEIMDFTCSWDNETNTVILILDSESVPETPDLPKNNIDLNPELNQKIIDEDVSYVSGSNDYSEIEKYIRENIDKNFNADDYIITENDRNMNGLYNELIIKLDVNGVSANFGYLVTCMNGKASLITFIGEKNADFDINKVVSHPLSDEEAKQKAIEADGYDYEVDEQIIYRFFDMKDLTYKCEVETVYIDNNGAYFATSHTF